MELRRKDLLDWRLAGRLDHVITRLSSPIFWRPPCAALFLGEVRRSAAGIPRLGGVVSAGSCPRWVREFRVRDLCLRCLRCSALLAYLKLHTSDSTQLLSSAARRERERQLRAPASSIARPTLDLTSDTIGPNDARPNTDAAT